MHRVPPLHARRPSPGDSGPGRPQIGRIGHALLARCALVVLALLAVGASCGKPGPSNTIFGEPFEREGFPAWNVIVQSPGGTIGLSTEEVAGGQSSARVTLSGDPDLEASLEKTLTPEHDAFYLHFRLRLASDFQLSPDGDLFLVNLLDREGAENRIGSSMLVKHELGGDYRLLWLVNDDDDQASFVPSAPLERDRWYEVELSYQTDAVDGGIEFWLDGRYQGRARGRSNAERPVDTMFLGALISENGAPPTGSIFFDNLTLGRKRVGAHLPYKPKVEASPAAVALATTLASGDPADAPVAVYNRGGDELSWQATTDAPWLTVSPTSGTVVNADGELVLSADTSALGAGSYQATLTVTNAGDPTDQQDVPVTLDINEDGTIQLTEGFEDPGLPGWASGGVGVAPAVSAAQARFGAHGLALDYPGSTANGHVRHPILDGGEVALSLQLFVDANFSPSSGARGLDVAGLAQVFGTATIPTTSLVLEEFADGKLYLYATAQTPGAQLIPLQPTAIERDRWIRVELRYRAGDPDGRLSLLIDGVFQDAIETTLPFGFDVAYLGTLDGQADASGRIHFDGLRVADMPIGDPLQPFDPAFGTDAASLDFRVTAGAPGPPQQTLAVRNLGGGVLDFTSASDVPWLTVSPAAGAVSGQPALLAATADASSLSPGVHAGTLTFQDSSDPGHTLAVPVSLTLNALGTMLVQDGFEAGLADWQVGADAGLGIEPRPDQSRFGAQSLRLDFSGPSTGHLVQAVETAGEMALSLQLYVDPTFAHAQPLEVIDLAGLSTVDDGITIPTALLALEELADGRLRLGVRYRSTAGSFDSLIPTTIERGRWIQIEIRYRSGDAGEIAYLVDGRLQDGITRSLPFEVDAVHLGVLDAGSGASGAIYLDGVRVADGPIGDPLDPFQLRLETTEPSLAFAVTAGTPPQTRPLGVYNDGRGDLAWTASSPAPWLALSPASGSVRSRPLDIDVTLDPSGLAPGAHATQITITNTSDPTDEVIVPVDVQLNPLGTTLFEDGFETDLSAWNVGASGGLGIAPSSAEARFGSSALQLDYAGTNTGHLFRSLDPSPELALGVQLFVDPGFAPVQALEAIDLAGISTRVDDVTLPTALLALVSQPDGSLELTVRYRREGGVFDALRPTTIPRGQWIQVEVRYRAGDPDGHIEYLVDGVLRDGISRSLPFQPDAVHVGGFNAGSGASGAVYLDGLLVGDGPIGDPLDPFTVAIGATVAGLGFETTVGEAPASQTLGTFNVGRGEIQWTAASDDPWLVLTPTSGTAGSRPAEIVASVDPTGLAPGAHATQVTLTNTGDPTDLVVVPVDLQINALGTSLLEEDFEVDLSAFTLEGAGADASLALSAPGEGGSAQSLVTTLSGADVERFIAARLDAPRNDTYLRYRFSVSSDYAISELDRLHHVMSLGDRDDQRYVEGLSMAIERSLDDDLRVFWSHFSNGASRQLNTLDPFDLVRDQWYCVEVHFVAETLGGGMEYWVDGVRRGAYFGRDTSTYPVSAIQLGSFGVDPNATVAGEVRFDELAIGDRRLGCGVPFVSEVAASESAIDFGATLGGPTPGPREVEIYNQGGGPLDWTATASAPFVTLSGASGTVTGDANTLSVSVDPSGLGTGVHAATVTVTNSADPTDQVLIPVTLTLDPNATLHFADGFQDPGLSVWTPSETPFRVEDLGEAVTLRHNTSAPFEGTGAIELEYSGPGTKQEFLDRDLLDDLDDLYVSLAIRVDPSFDIADPEHSVSLAALRSSDGISNRLAAVLLLDQEGDGSLKLRWGHAIPGGLRLMNPVPLTPGVWHTTEIHYVADAVQGGLEVWADGVYQGGDLGQDTSAYPANVLSVGSLGVEDDGDVLGKVFLDRPAVADARIGGGVPFVPDLRADAAAIALQVDEGETDPVADRIGVINFGGGTLDFSASVDEPWLSVAPAGGQVTTAAQSLDLVADPTGLPAGLHTANLLLTNDADAGDQQSVPVTLDVVAFDPSAPLVGTSVPRIDFVEPREDTDPADQTFQVTNTGGGTLDWSIASDAFWVTAQPTSGSLGPGASETVTVSTNVSALFLGLLQGTLTITNGADPDDVVELPVTIRTGFGDGFEGTDFGDWGNLGQNGSTNLTLSTLEASSGLQSLQAELLGEGPKQDYLTQQLDASHRQVRVAFSLRVGSDLAMQTGTTLEVARLGRAAGPFPRSAARLLLLGSPVGPRLVFEYATGTGQQMTAATSVELDTWVEVELFYVADPLNGLFAYRLDDTWVVEATGLANPSEEMNVVEVGVRRVDGPSGPLVAILGSFFLDDVDVRAVRSGLGTTTSSLAFETTEGFVDPGSQTVVVHHDQPGPLSWTAGVDAPWLSVSPGSGTFAGSSGEVEVSVQSAGLAAGTYTGTLTLTNDADPTDTATVHAQLTVNGDGTILLFEGFESPGFAPWIVVDDATDASLVLTTENTLGDQALRADLVAAADGAAFLQQAISDPREDVYLRFYLGLSSDYTLSQPLINHYLLGVLGDLGGSPALATSLAAFQEPDGSYAIGPSYVSSGGTVQLPTTPVQPGAWQCVEMRYRHAGGAVGLDYWVDGAHRGGDLQQASQVVTAETISLGSLGVDTGVQADGSVLFDGLVVADTRVGCGALFVPSIVADESAITLRGTAGSPGTLQVPLALRNAGGSSLSFTASADVPWIVLDATSGTVTGPDVGVGVSADLAGLAPGTHVGTITFTNAEDAGDTHQVTVNLEVSSDGTEYLRENFEGPPFADWLAGPQDPDVTVTTTTANAVEGSAAGIVTYTGGNGNVKYFFEQFDDELDDSYTRVFFYVEDDFELAVPFQATYFVSLGFQDEDTFRSATTLTMERLFDEEADPSDNGELFIYWTFFVENGQWANLKPFKVERGRWYSVEVHYVVDETDGGAEYWVDGVYQEGAFGQDTSNYPVNTIYTGSLAADPDGFPVGSVQLDALLLADRHIGGVVDFEPAVGSTEPFLFFERAVDGPEAPEQTFDVFNRGGATLDWTAQATAPWIQLDRTSGSVVGPSDRVTVSIDSSALGVGSHMGTIEIQNGSDPADVLLLPVSLEVRENGLFHLLDGFESGLDDWASANGDPAVVLATSPAQAAEGALSLEVAYADAPAGEQFLAQTLVSPPAELHTRFYLNLGADYDLSQPERSNLLARLGFQDANSFLPAVDLTSETTSTGQHRLVLRDYDGSEFQAFDPYELALDEWVCVEVRYWSDPSTGEEVELWVNGAHQGLIASPDPAPHPLNTLALGALGSEIGLSVDGSVFYDDVAIGDRRVGCSTPFDSQLAADPGVLDIAAADDAPSPQPRTLEIYNRGGSSLAWTATTSAPWLTLGETSGLVAGAASKVAVQVDSQGLAVGNHAATIDLANADDPADVLQVPVVVRVDAKGLRHLTEDFELPLTTWTTEGLDPDVALGLAPDPTNASNDVLTIGWNGNPAAEHFVRRDLEPVPRDLFIRFDLHLSSDYAITDPNRANRILRLGDRDANGFQPSIEVTTETGPSGEPLLVMRDYDGGNVRTFAPLPIETETWTCIELHYRNDAETGETFEYWVDGRHRERVSNASEDPVVPNALALGALGTEFSSPVDGTVRIDDLLVGDRRVGCNLAFVSQLATDPDALDVPTAVGAGAPLPRTIDVFNFGGSSLSWTATTSAPWLTLDATSGLVTGAASEVAVLVDSQGLAVGSHAATIDLANADDASDVLQVPVTVRVDADGLRYLSEDFEQPLAPWTTEGLDPDVVLGLGPDPTDPANDVLSVGWNGTAGEHFVRRNLEPAPRDLFIRFALHLSSDYAITDPNRANRIVRLGDRDPNGFQPAVEVTTETSPEGEPLLVMRDYDGANVRTFAPYPLATETWTCVELHYRNDPETGETFEYWVDGQHQARTSSPTVDPVSPNALAFGALGTEFSSPVTGTVSVDDVVVGDRRVGCTAQAFVPSVAAAPGGVLFEATRDGVAPIDQTFEVFNAGGGSLLWTASTTAPWLSLDRLSGLVERASDPVVLSADPTGLALGLHLADVVITNVEDPTDTLSVQVGLIVNEFQTSYFADGFESGDLAGFEELIESPDAPLVVMTGSAAEGTQSLGIDHGPSSDGGSRLRQALPASFDRAVIRFSLEVGSDYAVSQTLAPHDLVSTVERGDFFDTPAVLASLERGLDDGIDLLIQYHVAGGQRDTLDPIRLAPDTWYQIEVVYVADPLDGRVEVWVDGALESLVVSQDTGNFPISGIEVGSLAVAPGAQVSGTLHLDDVAVTDERAP